MDYFVIGAANFVDDSRDHESEMPPSSVSFYNADPQGGFALISFNKFQMSLTIISGANKELYQKVLKPRKPLSNS